MTLNIPINIILNTLIKGDSISITNQIILCITLLNFKGEIRVIYRKINMNSGKLEGKDCILSFLYSFNFDSAPTQLIGLRTEAV